MLLCLAILASACGGGVPQPDAYGTFEATEVLVSAETAGKLLDFRPQQGDRIEADAHVALVDTVQLDLQRRQLEAARRAAAAQFQRVEAQVGVQDEQLRVTGIELHRVERMHADSAATDQMRDDVAGRVAVLERQIAATRTQAAPIAAEVASIEAHIDQIDDQIRRAHVRNPVRGTVLATFVEPGELVGAGAPLYRLADLRVMTLRAYVDAAQLAAVNVGEPATVRFDDTDTGLAERDGVVTWIASEAQFTPRHIQTRDERINLVYAVKVRVDNADGRIRIGMPGELFLGE